MKLETSQLSGYRLRTQPVVDHGAYFRGELAGSAGVGLLVEYVVLTTSRSVAASALKARQE